MGRSRPASATKPNPAIDWANSPFHVAEQTLDWPRGDEPVSRGILVRRGWHQRARRPGEAPPASPSGPSRPQQLLVLSAKSRASLDAYTEAGPLAGISSRCPFGRCGPHVVDRPPALQAPPHRGGGRCAGGRFRDRHEGCREDRHFGAGQAANGVVFMFPARDPNT